MLQSKGLAQWRQLARRQFCANLHVIIPQQVQWKPPLRQAAGTLAASVERTVRKAMSDIHLRQRGKT